MISKFSWEWRGFLSPWWLFCECIGRTCLMQIRFHVKLFGLWNGIVLAGEKIPHNNGFWSFFSSSSMQPERRSSSAEEERSSLAIKNRCPVIRIFIANLRSWRRDSHGNEAFSHAFKLSTYYPDHYYEKHICKPYFSDGKMQGFIYSPLFMVHFSMIPSTVTF